MRVPPVPVELLLAGHEIANRPGRQCVINTLLAEQKPYGFDLIYAATQRICALTEALQSPDLDEWLVFGTPYYAVSDALWAAAARVALYSTGNGSGPYEDHGSFDLSALQRSAASQGN
jgi:hypothetical protein